MVGAGLLQTPIFLQAPALMLFINTGDGLKTTSRPAGMGAGFPVFGLRPMLRFPTHDEGAERGELDCFAPFKALGDFLENQLHQCRSLRA